MLRLSRKESSFTLAGLIFVPCKFHHWGSFVGLCWFGFFWLGLGGKEGLGEAVFFFLLFCFFFNFKCGFLDQCNCSSPWRSAAHDFTGSDPAEQCTLQWSYSWRGGDRMFSCRQYAIIHCHLLTADPAASTLQHKAMLFSYRKDKPPYRTEVKSSKCIQRNNQFLHLQV